MLILNRQNAAYVNGKRRTPTISFEAYDHLVKQIEKLPRFALDDHALLPPHKNITFQEIAIVLLILSLGIVFMVLALGSLRLMILRNLNNSIIYMLIDSIPVILTSAISIYLFRVLWILYLSFRTHMRIINARKVIKKGKLIIGQVEAIQVVEKSKEKPRGRKKINIEYAFTSPDNERLRGVFTTSKIKAVASGDEVAVLYIKKSLHILL